MGTPKDDTQSEPATQRLEAIRCSIRLREQGDDSGIWRIVNETCFQLNATHLDPFQSLEAFRLWFAGLGSERFDLIAEVDGEISGFASLLILPDRQNHAGWFVLGVCQSVQNQGIGRKLLQMIIWISDLVYGLRRLQLIVYSTNAVARHLYETFGFVIEGRHIDFVRVSGQFVDGLTMARVKAQTRPPKSAQDISDRLHNLVQQMDPQQPGRDTSRERITGRASGPCVQN